AGPPRARVLATRPGAVRTAAYRGLKRLAGQLTRAGARGATPGAQRMLKDGT
ncbi:RNA polymerase sigma factor, partial [Streptomyces anulatus]